MDPDSPSQPDETSFDEIFMTELLWNAGDEEGLEQHAEKHAVGTSGGQTIMHAGPGGWRPAHIVTLAAACCFTDVLRGLADAAGIRILAYVWSSKLRVSRDDRKMPVLTLSPCFVVATEAHASKLKTLCAQAADSSIVCRLLRGRLVVVPDIQVIAPLDRSPDE